MTYRYIVLFCVLVSVITSKAQDPSFSQFYVNKVYLNPAATGADEGLTLTSIYKNQWRAVPGAFHTVGFAMDMQMPRFSSGIGFTGFRDAVSNGALVTYGAGFSYAYIIRIAKEFNIHIGLSANYLRKSIDPSKLIFSDQLDPFLGNINSTSAVIPNESVGFFDMGAGILARFTMKIANVDIHNSIGFAVSHLTSPDESFLNIESKLPRRYTIHYGSMIPIAHNIVKGRSSFYLSPIFKFDYQNSIKIFTAGVLTMLKPFYTGFMFQDNKFNNQDSKTLIFTGGVDADIGDEINMILGYSYDLNMTGIASPAKGVHELSLKLIFKEAVLFGKPKIKNGKKNTKCYQFKGKNSIRLF